MPDATYGRRAIPRAGLVLTLAVATALTALTAVAPSPAMAASPVSLSGASWIWYPEGNPAQSAPLGDPVRRLGGAGGPDAVGPVRLFRSVGR